MAQVNIIQQNWSGGELSPKMRGRYDLPVYVSGAERIVNFISEPSGPARFRPGFTYVNNTRRNNIANLVPFQFSDSQDYLMEFTAGYIRFFTNNGIVVLPAKTITAITKASPGVLTSASHSFANGDEVIISGINGMIELNGRSFVVANVTTNTFTLQDQFGNDISTSALTTYTSGGIAEKIYEITSPYATADLFQLKFAQNADTVYVVHPNYEPMKLVRAGSTNWTLALFTRTDDPFLSKIVISAITQANPAVVTATGHGYSTGQQIIINTVVGMTQLNNSISGTNYTITKIDADNFSLVGVDSSGYTAYSSAGYASDFNLLPGAVAFFQGRIVYGYSGSYPESIWGSKPLDSSGNPQYDVMTIGTNATDGYKFTIAPATGKVVKIQSLVATLNFLAICAQEGIYKADGGQAGDPISPVAIDITPAVTFGVLKEITPILLGVTLIFMHRSAQTIFSLEYDIFFSAYNAIDKNLSNEHINESGIFQMVYQFGRPSIFWQVRNDGILVGTTFNLKENINGAHRHIIGGTNSKVVSAGVMPRVNAFDQLWAVNERTINGQTCRYVEYQNDDPVVPERQDYWTGAANENADDMTWRNAMFEIQKQFVNVDAALTYDGSVLGLDANANMTPGAVLGTAVTFTASAAVFTAGMVGQEIWKKSIKGFGTGRATITGFTSSTVVTCKITSVFDSTTVMAAGNWYLTAMTLRGLNHLEGQTVAVVTDGGEHATRVVTAGVISLQYQASMVQVGLQYYGLLKSMNIEAGGVNGPSQGKQKNVNNIGLKFLNTLGASYGTSLYNMEEVEFRQLDDYVGRPPPLFSAIKKIVLEDDTDYEKHIYIQQTHPLPCTVLEVIPFVDTDN